MDMDPDHFVKALQEVPSFHDNQAQTVPSYYVYCHPPAPVPVSGVLERRPKYRNNVKRPQGAHSYYNMMWDGRIHKVSLNKSALREAEECEKIRQKLFRDSKTSRRRTLKEIRDELERKKVDSQTAMYQEYQRFSRLKIFNLSMKTPEQYMVDLNDGMDKEMSCEKVQELRTFPVAPSRNTDVQNKGTQIIPGEFFDFDTAVIPHVERLVGRVCQQSILELLDEDEFDALQKQQENFVYSRNYETQRLKELTKRAIKIEQEKARLSQAAKDKARGLKDVDSRMKAGMYSECVASKLLIDTVKELQRSGFLGETDKKMSASIVPWINKGVGESVKQKCISDAILNAIILEVTAKREAEYAAVIWNDAIKKPLVPTFGHDIKEKSRVPPPAPPSSLYNANYESEATDGFSVISDN